MVWIMSLPSGLGEFWPDGEFEGGDKAGSVGWSGRLKAFIKDLPVQRQKDLMPTGDLHDYGYFVAQKFKSEVENIVASDLPPITPVLDHEAPKTFDTVKTYKRLGDFIMLNSRILAVSEDMKAIIEALDRGAHQFFPIDIVMPRSVYPKRFFTFVVTNYRNSYIDVNGVMLRLAPGERYNFSKVTKGEAAQSHFQKVAFDNAHVWRERLFNEFIIMFSNEFVDCVQNAGLSMPKIYQAKEIV